MTQRSFSLLGSFLLPAMLLCGCPPPNPGNGPAPTAGPSTAPSTSATTTPANPADKAAWVGSWINSSCGSRSYPRVITLAADGSFTAQENVSPCPPKVACVWSGVVRYQGTWQIAGGGVTLTKTGGDTPPPKITLATALSWNADQGAPADAADPSCLYQHHAATPAPKP